MMLARRSRRSAIAALLAIVALIVLVGVSSWHGTIIQDDAIHLIALDHDDDHGSSSSSDQDGAAHLLAHATGQWMAFGAPLMPLAVVPTIAPIWSVRAALLHAGIDPAGLLRPPRG